MQKVDSPEHAPLGCSKASNSPILMTRITPDRIGSRASKSRVPNRWEGHLQKVCLLGGPLGDLLQREFPALRASFEFCATHANAGFQEQNIQQLNAFGFDELSCYYLTICFLPRLSPRRYGLRNWAANAAADSRPLHLS